MSYLPGKSTIFGTPPARVMVQQGVVWLWCDVSLAVEKISSSMIHTPKQDTLKTKEALFWKNPVFKDNRESS